MYKVRQMTRDERRHSAAKAKARATIMLRRNGFAATPAQVGKAATQHGTCACHTCRYKDPAPVRKLARDERLIYWEH